jgi:tetratricopeptide (TPR) repeat protein
MKNETDNLITRAEAYMNKRRFSDAGRCYEMVAAAVDDKRETVEFLRKAAEAYDKWRDSDNIARCYKEASQFLEGMEKAECLLDCWRVYISAIAEYEWECCFEWRGDNSHADDHDLYQGLIEQRQHEAENILREALSIKGVNKRKIVKQAEKECRRRKRQDGWGASRCWNIIRNTSKGS